MENGQFVIVVQLNKIFVIDFVDSLPVNRIPLRHFVQPQFIKFYTVYSDKV